MANEKKYIRNIYANGVPYTVRDEEAQTNIAQLNATINTLNKITNSINDVISNNFDEKTFIGNVTWDRIAKLGSEIPHFEVVPIANVDGDSAYQQLNFMEY